MNNQLDNLLKQVQISEARRLQKIEEERKRGEWFNVFEVLGFSTDEVRTHSAFIAELLNPNGDHGCGDLFLKAFIDDICCLKGFEIPPGITKTIVEYDIGQINQDSTEGGRIDILVDVGSSAIIIENKIYAADQENQIIRYYNYAIKRYGNNYKILYLTLEGNAPSQKSIGNKLKEGLDFYTISYAKDIALWLQHCMHIAINKPLVRETIAQYITLISHLTNQNMNESEKEEIYELLTQYPEAAASILNTNRDEYIMYLYQKFAQPTFNNLDDLVFVDDNLKLENKEKGFYFKRKEWKNYAIWIYSEKSGLSGFFYGISNYQGGPYISAQRKLDCLKKNTNESWPYGWSRFDYSEWNSSVIPDLISGKFANTTIERVREILSEVEEKQLTKEW